MSARARVGVLALQGGVREHVSALERSGAQVSLVRRADDLERLDGLVLPGGESGVMDRLMRAFGIAAPLAAAIRAGLPVLGTCAGLILLADRIENPAPGQQSVGGLNVTVRRNAFGGQRESFDTRVTVEGMRTPVDASFIRAPIVIDHGDGVEVIARCEGVVVGVRAGSITGLSFHPEVTGDDRLHAGFVASL